MYTKLYIPYNLETLDRSKFLLVTSRLSVPTLTLALVAKMFFKQLSKNEELILLWLAEKPKPKVRAKIFYLLTILFGSADKNLKNGIYPLFPLWYWEHQNLEKIFPQFRGCFKSQCHRLAGQVEYVAKICTKKNVKFAELRWMGVGHRDSGSLSSFHFNIEDLQNSDTQVIYRALFARLADELIKHSIYGAKEDLKKFALAANGNHSSKFGGKPSEESKGLDESEDICRTVSLIFPPKSCNCLGCLGIRETEPSFSCTSKSEISDWRNLPEIEI